MIGKIKDVPNVFWAIFMAISKIFSSVNILIGDFYLVNK